MYGRAYIIKICEIPILLATLRSQIRNFLRYMSFWAKIASMKITRSVSDMPKQQRLACEHLCAGFTYAQIAHCMGLKVGSVALHLAYARKRTGTHSAAELVRWCKAGRDVRPVSSIPPWPTITALDPDGIHHHEVRADSCFRALASLYPDQFLAHAHQIRQKRDKDRRVAASIPPIGQPILGHAIPQYLRAPAAARTASPDQPDLGRAFQSLSLSERHLRHAAYIPPPIEEEDEYDRAHRLETERLAHDPSASQDDRDAALAILADFPALNRNGDI